MSTPQGPAPIAYVLGHYPRLAQTFIRQEIRSLEELGQPIVPISVNVPVESDRATDDLRAEHARTFYVKSVGARGAATALLRAVRASPRGLLATLALAVRSAGFDLRAQLYHFFYVIEGLVVWDRCRAAGVRRMHTHFAVPTSTVAWFATEFGCQVDGPGTWSWSLTVHGPHDFFDESRMLLSYKASSLGAVVCITDYARSQVIRQLDPAHWHKVHVVRCGIDLDRFLARPPRPLGTPPTVLMVGRLAPEKGHRVLVEAAALLHARGVDIVVELVGAGPERDALAAAAAASGIADSIRFAGEMPSDQVALRLREADVFCLPSFAEGLPIAIMEAMAVGVPVVTTYLAGIPELVADGVTGALVPSGRADLLADALEHVLTDGPGREALVVAGRARVTAEHEVHAQARKLVAVLTAPPEPA